MNPNEKNALFIVRVGDKYYQHIETPEGIEIWKYRDKRELQQDGVNLRAVPHYHGFTNHPDFLDYQQVIKDYLNLAEPLIWKPKEGAFPTITALFTHIFGEQILLGYDYYSLLLRRPRQILPIVVVVSAAQGTGKSTLLNFNRDLFGGNCIVIKVAEYAQQFNGLYASKLLICIDETILSGSGIKEKIKSDSTADTIQLRKMHTEHETIPFYGKFFLATNREKDFAQVEETDERFWVRKVGPIEHFDASFKEKLRAEIPTFVHFLLNRELSVPEPLSRQWFSSEQLKTQALLDAKEYSMSECAKDIKIWIDDILAAKETVDKRFGATVSEIWEELGRTKYTRTLISDTLRNELKYPSPAKTHYYRDRYGNRKTGKAYMFGGEDTVESEMK